MSDVKSVRFRQDQVSVLNGNNCPLSAGFSVRNHRNTQLANALITEQKNKSAILRSALDKYFDENNRRDNPRDLKSNENNKIL